MIIATLAALTFSGAVAAGLLWVLGFGGQTGQEAVARLGRIRNGEGDSGAIGGAPPVAAKGASPFKIRRPSTVSLGGITLVSGKVSANWAKQLERSGLTLTPREYLILRAVVGALLAAVIVMLTGFPIAAIAAFPIGFALPALYVKMRIGGRLKKMESQMIEMLQMLASGLRAGFGLQQALEAASEQVPDPLALELKRTMRDIAMGSSVEQALGALNNRVGSADFDIVITAILIQRSVGGNLAEILDNVAHTLRERERIRGEIATLTAQQKLTGIVIGGIPFGLAAFFFLVNPEFVSVLFTDPLGRMMLIGALALEGAGAFCIKKIVNIEV